MKNYLVIGASSGIGRQLALNLSSSGNMVWGTYFKSEPGIQSENIQYHYLDATAVSNDLDFLPETIDGLAYCPGSIVLRPFHRIKPGDFIKDYELQVVGAIRILQAVSPRFRKNSVSSVVLFSTVAVQSGFNFHSMISTSKGAIEGLTRSLAAELAPSVRVNCIAPSLTDTPLAGNLLGTEEKKLANAQRHPLKRIGNAGDIAAMAEFLLSEKASWITGQVFHVDGGISSLKV